MYFSFHLIEGDSAINALHISLYWYYSCLLRHCEIMQDSDFVADKDDGGSPTDDSGEEDSDASESGGEKEVFYLKSLGL